jgi:hypothetical protein
LLEPYLPWQERAEGALRELKHGLRQLMDDIKAHNYFENFMLPFAVILWHGDSQEEHPIYTQGECDHERHKHKAV